MEKPCAPACERNQQAILDKLCTVFAHNKRVLEVGSGTGQHAVYFAERLPHIYWQCSDQAEYIAGIELWARDSGLSNIGMPLELEVNKEWPVTEQVDGIFSANTLHIMSWQSVQSFFNGVGQHLEAGGVLVIYGPFNYGGEYTSKGNADFDMWLQQRNPESAIRGVEDVERLAKEQGLYLQKDHEMPANNRLLVFKKAE